MTLLQNEKYFDQYIPNILVETIPVPHIHIALRIQSVSKTNQHSQLHEQGVSHPLTRNPTLIHPTQILTLF